MSKICMICGKDEAAQRDNFLHFNYYYSDPRHDPHPVRLLTLARTSRAAPDTSSVCLAIAISTRDKAIIVSCQDTQVTACVYINSILKM